MTDRLERYREMRDFSRTPEPGGRTKKKKIAERQPLHYYIQRHDATRLHYDLRLELEGVLKSWAVLKGPSLEKRAPKKSRRAAKADSPQFVTPQLATTA